jgi:hypothetical protein
VGLTQHATNYPFFLLPFSLRRAFRSTARPCLTPSSSPPPPHTHTPQQALSSLPDLARQLAALYQRGARVSPLAAMLCRALAPLAGARERHARLLEQLVSASSGGGNNIQLLSDDLAADVARQLLQRAAEAEPGGAADAYLSRVLRALDLRHPAQVDDAVNAALALEVEAAAAGENQAAAARREALFDFVSRCFAGSRHELIGAVGNNKGSSGPAAGGKSKTSKSKGKKKQPEAADEPRAAQGNDDAAAPLTLAVAVNAAAEGLRAMALERLGLAAADPDAGSDVRELLRGAALRGLSDASLAVASAAAASVAAPGHGVAPAAADALPALAALLRRAGSVLTSPSAPKAERRLALTAGRAALAAVGRLAALADAGEVEQEQEAAAAVLLEWCVADGRRKLSKLARAVVAAAADAIGGKEEVESAAPASAAAVMVLAALASARAGVREAAAAAADDDTTTKEDDQHQAPRTPSKSPQKSKGGKPPSSSGGSKRGAARAAVDHDDDDDDDDDEAGEEGSSRALLRSAAAHNRAVADALGRALGSSAPSDPASFASLYARAAPAARHALVLGLARATALLTSSSSSPSSPPSAKKPAGRDGKKAAPSEQQSQGLPRVAALLVGALLASLRDQSSSLSLSGGAELAAEAARLVDGEGLPTPAHAASLQKQRQERAADAALLCGATFAAASAAAPEALAAALGGSPGAAVAALAGHAGAACGADAAGALGPLVVLLAGKAAEAGGSGDDDEDDEEDDEDDDRAAGGGRGALSLLSRLFGLPDAVAAAASPGAQAAALRLAELAARDARPDHGAWFARMLAAAGSGDAAVREAAAAALRVLGQGEVGGKTAAEQHPLLAVCRALAPHLPLVAANPRALSVLLTGALARQAEAAAAVTPRGKKAGGGRGRGCRSAAAATAMDVDADDDLPALELDARAADGLRGYLRARLPLLDGPACLSAAQLALDLLSLPEDEDEEEHEEEDEGAAAPSSPADDADVSAALRLLPRLVAALRSDAGPAPDAEAAALFAGGSLPDDAARQLASARAALACRLLQLLRARASSLAGSETPAPDALLDALAAPLTADADACRVRVAALEALTPRAFAGLPGDAYRASALSALLRASASDGDAAARSAARAALAALPLTAGSLAPLALRAAGSGGACGGSPSSAGRGGRSAKKPRKGAAGGGGDREGGGDAAAPPPPPRAADVDASLPCLELLQWKPSVRGAAQLIAPLQAVVMALMPCMGSIAERHEADDNEEGEEEEEQEKGERSGAAAPAPAAPADGGPVRPSTAGYAVQLALAALRRLATGDLADDDDDDDAEADDRPKQQQQQQKQPPKGRRPAAASAASSSAPSAFDLPLALRAARDAPDAAARNAALSLLAALARLAPDSMLQHVIQVSFCFLAFRWGWGANRRGGPDERGEKGPMIIPIDSNQSFHSCRRGTLVSR